MEYGNLKTAFNLHTSCEALLAVDIKRTQGERIPNTPSGILGAYLGNLSIHSSLFNNTVPNYESRRDKQIQTRVVSADLVPASQIARIIHTAAEGIQTPEDVIDRIQKDQAESLKIWIDYLSNPELLYPTWFRYFAYRSVFQLSKYDTEHKRFKNRNSNTISPYPELNQEALSTVYDRLIKPDVREQKGFAVLYAEEIDRVASTERNTDTTEGVWTKYSKSSKAEDAARLSSSLQGYNTTWCTAGMAVAQSHLNGGDFYVYYTFNSKGLAVIPRLAIRMNGDMIGEIRGVAPQQSIEDVLLGQLREKLLDFPGADKYIQYIDNHKLDDAYDFTAANIVEKKPTAELSLAQLSALYSLDIAIEDSRQAYMRRLFQRQLNAPDAVMSTMRLENTRDSIESRRMNELRNKRAKDIEDIERILPDTSIIEKAVRTHSTLITKLLLSNPEYKNDDMLVEKMAQYGAERTANIVASNIRVFTELGNVAAETLIRYGFESTFSSNINHFANLSSSYAFLFTKDEQLLRVLLTSGGGAFKSGFDEIVQTLLDAHPHLIANAIKRSINDIPSLSFEIAQKLVNIGKGRFVHDYIDHFPGVDSRIGKGRARLSVIRRSKKPLQLVQLLVN